MQKIGKIIWGWIEIAIKVILETCCKWIKKELTESMLETILQFVKFGIVGVSNTVISYVLYVISLFAFQKSFLFIGYDYLIAQVVAFVLSVLWSFYWNNKMVFQPEANKERNIWKALVKTYVSYSFTGLFLNSILLLLWVDLLNISEFIAPILNLFVSIPINFIINKFWAFK